VTASQPSALAPSAIADVIKERYRQITEERANSALDDQHTELQLARAAAAYALHGAVWAGVFGDQANAIAKIIDPLWPDDFTDMKPQEHRRNCVRAAALLLAEIERLDRFAARRAA